MDRGRPRKATAYKYIRNVRIDEDEAVMIEYFREKYDLSISDIFRRSLRFYYNFVTKRSQK